MEPVRSNFLIFAYVVPFGSFPILFLFVSIINRRTDFYLLKSIMGLERRRTDNKSKSNKDPKPQRAQSASVENTSSYWCCPNESIKSQDKNDNREKDSDQCFGCCREPTKEQESQVESYLNINFEEGEDEEILPLQCWKRVFSDLLMSAILAVFVAILFFKLGMSNGVIASGDQCPDYNAYCFLQDDFSEKSVFKCTKGAVSNYSSSGTLLWCAGWVIGDVSVDDVLNALGICGGLLGIVASIVPLTYYLSYNTCKTISVICIVIPLMPIAALVLLVRLSLPRFPSQLSVVILGVVIVMTLIGWLWALVRSIGCPCCSKRPKSVTRKSCCCICRCCSGIYRHYPWTAFSRCCRN